MSAQTLADAFLEELRDVLSAERQLTKALPKMAKGASNEQLRSAIESHLEETRQHVTRLEGAFESLGETPRAKKCEAMEGLIAEGSALLDEDAAPEVKDALLIAAAQKVEHYEIATYGTLCTWAKLLGHDEALTLLKTTMSEEEAADQKLTELSEQINEAASQPVK